MTVDHLKLLHAMGGKGETSLLKKKKYFLAFIELSIDLLFGQETKHSMLSKVYSAFHDYYSVYD